MITARNYAAQAEREIRTICENMLKGPVKRPLTKASLECVADIISEAVHFAIPDNGTILGAERKALYGQKVQLPFPIITVEYFTDEKHHISESIDKVYASKRVVVAIENKLLSEKFNIDIDIDGFCCFSVFYAERFGKWVPQLFGGIVDTEWDRNKGNGLNVFCFCPELSESIKENIVEAKHDIYGDCGDILELIEALTCRNVTTEPLEKIDHRVNERRIKAGKLPIYETKVLTLKVNETVKQGERTGFSHASPRQHLRRGHIRRHPTAGNIWVNNCVVGSAEKGFIEKQYKIAA